MSFEAAVNELWEAKASDPTVIKAKEAQDTIKGVLEGLNSGSIRIADPPQEGSDSWAVNAYAKGSAYVLWNYANEVNKLR